MMTLKDNLYIRKKERVYKYKSTLSTKLISVQIFQELKKKKESPSARSPVMKSSGYLNIDIKILIDNLIVEPVAM